MVSRLFGHKQDPLDEWLETAVDRLVDEFVLSETTASAATIVERIRHASRDPFTLTLFHDHHFLYPFINYIQAYWNGLNNTGEPLVLALTRMDVEAVGAIVELLSSDSGSANKYRGLDSEYADIMNEDMKNVVRNRGRPHYPASGYFRNSTVGNWHFFGYWAMTLALSQIVEAHRFNGYQEWMGGVWNTVYWGISTTLESAIRRDGDIGFIRLLEDIDRAHDRTKATIKALAGPRL